MSVRVSCVVTLALLAPVYSTTASAETSQVVAVIVNPKNKIESMDKAELRNVFLKRKQTWPGGARIVPINGAPKSAARTTFERVVLGMNSQQVAQFWIKQSVTGKARPPRSVSAPVMVRRLVAALKGAIAYLPLDMVDGTVRVVAVDKLRPDDPKYLLRSRK